MPPMPGEGDVLDTTLLIWHYLFIAHAGTGKASLIFKITLFDCLIDHHMVGMADVLSLHGIW